jgi:hypothetical protein
MTINTDLITETINIIRAFVLIFAFALIVADITELHKTKSFKLMLLCDCFYLMAAVIINCFLQLIVSAITSEQQPV